MNDRDFIDAAAKGLRIEAEPFAPLAERLGLSVDEVIARIARLIGEGKVRRFAASVRHQPLGFAENAMVIARVTAAEIERAGQAAAGIDAVSHAYQRSHPDGDPDCLYIMVHGQDFDTVAAAVETLKSLPGVKAVEVCRSRGELKKISLSGVTTDLDNDR